MTDREMLCDAIYQIDDAVSLLMEIECHKAKALRTGLQALLFFAQDLHDSMDD